MKRKTNKQKPKPIRYFGLACLLLLGLSVVAQKETTKQGKIKKTIVVGVTVGSQGLGIDLKKQLTSRLYIRGGYSYLPGISVTATTVDQFAADKIYKSNFSNAHLFLEVSPFKSNGFRLVGGAAYFLSGNFSYTEQPTGTYNYGQFTFTPADIGTLQLTSDWKGVALYGGMSLFKFTPKHFLNVSVDLGTYLLKSPNTNVISTNMLAGNTNPNNLTNWNEDISQLRWYPVLQLNFNIK